MLQLLQEVEVGSTFHNGPRLQRIFSALRRGVILGNVACNLFRNGTTTLQGKLPSVTAL